MIPNSTINNEDSPIKQRFGGCTDLVDLVRVGVSERDNIPIQYGTPFYYVRIIGEEVEGS